MQIFFEVLGYLGAFFVAGVSVPELFSIYKTKKTSHISFTWYGVLLVGCMLFAINGLYFVVKDFDSVNNFSIAVTVANIFSFISTGIVLINKIYNIVMSKKRNITEKEYELIRKNKNKTVEKV